MKSKFLQQIKIVEDITTATDKGDAGSLALLLTLDETATKLQHCDTSDGSFKDFKTLDDGTGDGFKSYQIDLSGAKKFIKVTGATGSAVLGDKAYNPADETKVIR